jgi:hypothetical protein
MNSIYIPTVGYSEADCKRGIETLFVGENRLEAKNP